MVAALILPLVLRAEIEDAARAASPRECCGLIEGRLDGDAIHAVALHPARNLSPDADRFEIDPADHFRALRAARANGHVIVGCYHSHPNGKAQPSARDFAGALEENFIWLICGVTAEYAQTEAFLFVRGAFVAVKVQQPGTD
jgi:proteasome lid subunit RPN8/RPN11